MALESVTNDVFGRRVHSAPSYVSRAFSVLSWIYGARDSSCVAAYLTLYVPVYLFIPCVFARVNRAFAVRPLVQFQVRFAHCAFPYFKKFHCKQLAVPGGCNSFTAGFFSWAHLSVTTGSVVPYISPVRFLPRALRHSPLRYWTLPMVFLFPKKLVRYNSTCSPSCSARREWDRIR